MFEIPQGWWRLELTGMVITNGDDIMVYIPGLGYTM